MVAHLTNNADPLRTNIRNRVFFVWMLVWCSLMTIMAATGSILSYLVLRNHRIFRFWTVFWARSMFFGCGIRIRSVHACRLDPEQPYVFAGNHQNSFDIPATALAISHPFGFIAKAELAQVPMLGWAIRFSPSVFLDRSTARKAYYSMLKAARRIRDGLSVIIFPEGSRSWSRDIQPFQKGTFLLALQAGVPIVPITIIDAYRVLDERRRLSRPGTIHIHVGEPVSLDGLSKQDLPTLMKRIENDMKSILKQDDSLLFDV